MASQDLLEDLSTDMFCPVVSIGLGLKQENAGHQVSGNPKINDAQSNSRFKQFIVVHQDV